LILKYYTRRLICFLEGEISQKRRDRYTPILFIGVGVWRSVTHTQWRESRGKTYTNSYVNMIVRAKVLEFHRRYGIYFKALHRFKESHREILPSRYLVILLLR